MAIFLSATNLADLTGTSLATAQKWGENGVYPYHRNENGKMGFWMEELNEVQPVRGQLFFYILYPAQPRRRRA